MSPQRSRWSAAVRLAGPALGWTVLWLGACAPEPPEKTAAQAGVVAGCPCGGDCEQGGCGMGGPGMGAGRGRGMGPMCPMGTGPLTDPVRDAVVLALQDEWRAEASYNAVLAELGQVLPFKHVERAEQRHSSALERLLTAHGAAIPAQSPLPPAPKYGTLPAACAAGVSAEKANIALYDDLAKNALPDDVKCVFDHLRAASQNHHLPAFQACSGN